MLSALSVAASLLGAVTSFFKWFGGYQQKKMGAMETGYEAAKDARRRAALRKAVETKIKTLNPNELSERLRSRVRKSRFGDDKGGSD